MEQDREKQHFCKLCNKSFLSGRILGGHMRNHFGKSSAKGKVKLEISDVGVDGYGLRENPQKSWKSSGLIQNDGAAFQEDVKCRICGKQFESARSLHGHLRHHSVEERSGIRCKECGKGFRSLKSLTGHMRLHSKEQKLCGQSSSRPNLIAMTLSETESASLVRRKRSNRMRYKATPNSSFSSFNGSVSGFAIEQEVKEVAMSLMMLSRGVFELGESLDYDSVSFEAKSSFPNERNGRIDGNELTKKKKPKEEMLILCASDSKKKISEFSDSDCDVVRNQETKIELEVPIESMYCQVDSKRIKLEDESMIEKGIHENESEVEFGIAGWGYLESTPINSTENMCSTSDFDSKKRCHFQCRICTKAFPTYQALGGHQTFHRTKNSVALKIEPHLDNILPEKTDVIKFEDMKYAVEEEVTGVSPESNKSKTHKCHICLKNFVSGQALGGHKRAHIAKAKEEQNAAVKEEVSTVSDALEVNFPNVLINSQANQEAGFTSWWPGGSFKYESLMHVVAN